MELIARASTNLDSIAVLADGQIYSYRYVVDRSQQVATYLLGEKTDLNESRIAFMVKPGVDYVTVLWGIWQAGGVAVPLCLDHPRLSLIYTLSDSGSKTVVTSQEFEFLLEPICREMEIKLIILQRLDVGNCAKMPLVLPKRRALILYTSGTTNLPKGVVTTHENLIAQITSLVAAWKWSASDHTLCVLPLHHVHGIVNVVCCSLWVGARCEFLPTFDSGKVFEVFRHGHVNVFMAVPTIYFKLIAFWDGLAQDQKKILTPILSSFRLMVSGSAALPVSVMENWKKISNHFLLERYGMTELGMAISNPYEGERRPGHVGIALPGVSIRLCDEKDELVINEPGEIQVKGDNVFLEYWGKPEETKKTFTKDGWFKTGDVAVVENGYYKILGRNSVDIIKSGGYKISALEIEETLRQHPGIKDCAVVGLENEEWGEIVGAAMILQELDYLDTSVLAAWLKERMPAYRMPRKFIFVKDLPRNTMGKVLKNDVKKLFSI